MKIKKPLGKKKNVRFFSPPNILREKIGKGGIDPVLLAKAEEFIDNNELDFLPEATSILERLNVAIAAARKMPKAGRESIDAIIGPVMELKANGGMFRYQLMTDIADIILGFLEGIDEMNEDAFGVVDVHQKALEAIIKSRLSGTGSREGQALVYELSEACQRYRKKYSVLVDVSE